MNLQDLEADVVKVEGWFVEGIKLFAKALPILDDVAALFPGLPAWVGQVLSAVPDMIIAMEQAVPATGNGALKLSGVLNCVETLCTDLDNDLTGAAASTFLAIKNTVVNICNEAVTAANALKPIVTPPAS